MRKEIYIKVQKNSKTLECDTCVYGIKDTNDSVGYDCYLQDEVCVYSKK